MSVFLISNRSYLFFLKKLLNILTYLKKIIRKFNFDNRPRLLFIEWMIPVTTLQWGVIWNNDNKRKNNIDN